jgi:hypothetical protein
VSGPRPKMSIGCPRYLGIKLLHASCQYQYDYQISMLNFLGQGYKDHGSFIGSFSSSQQTFQHLWNSQGYLNIFQVTQICACTICFFDFLILLFWSNMHMSQRDGTF